MSKDKYLNLLTSKKPIKIVMGKKQITKSYGAKDKKN